MRNKLILAIITLICGFLISGFYYLLNEKIQKTQSDKELSIKKTFFPDGKYFEETEIGLIIVKNETKTELGYLYLTEDPSGYSGKVKFLVALNLDGTVKDFLMTEHNETPGLGTEVNSAWFKKGFKDVYPLPENLPTGKKDFKEKLGIDAISGATISSMATVRAISKDAKKYTQWCLDRKIKKTESIYQSVDKNTYQNFNIIIKKKPAPQIQPPVQQNNQMQMQVQPQIKVQPGQQQPLPQRKFPKKVQPQNQEQPKKPEFKSGVSPL